MGRFARGHKKGFAHCCRAFPPAAAVRCCHSPLSPPNTAHRLASAAPVRRGCHQSHMVYWVNHSTSFAGLVGNHRLASASHASAFAPAGKHHRAAAPASRTLTTAMAKPRDDPTQDEKITILGFGSLMSVKSARLTFPDLENFCLGRVPDHRRVFAHPANCLPEGHRQSRHPRDEQP
jgi:hypothetical protein